MFPFGSIASAVMLPSLRQARRVAFILNAGMEKDRKGRKKPTTPPPIQIIGRPSRFEPGAEPQPAKYEAESGVVLHSGETGRDLDEERKVRVPADEHDEAQDNRGGTRDEGSQTPPVGDVGRAGESQSLSFSQPLLSMWDAPGRNAPDMG